MWCATRKALAACQAPLKQTALETDCMGLPRSAKGMKKVQCSGWHKRRTPLCFHNETAAMDVDIDNDDVLVFDDDDFDYDDYDDDDNYNENEHYD